MYEYRTVFNFHKFKCRTQDVSSITLKSIISVCASYLCMFYRGPGLASKLFVMSQMLFIAPPLKIRFAVSIEKMHAELTLH